MDASFWMRVYKNLQLTDPRESTHNFARTRRLMSIAQGPDDFHDRNRLKIVGAIFPWDVSVPRWRLSLMRLTAYKQEAFIHGRNRSLLIMYIILNLSTEQNGLDKHSSVLLRKWKRYITQKHRPWIVTTQTRNGKLILLAHPRAWIEN